MNNFCIFILGSYPTERDISVNYYYFILYYKVYLIINIDALLHFGLYLQCI